MIRLPRMHLLLACAVLCSLVAERELLAQRVLTTVAQIKHLKQLTDDEGVAAVPLRLRGVVTYYNREAGQAWLQDATGGIAFNIGAPGHPEQLELARGDVVEVEGMAIPNHFLAEITGQSEGDPVRVEVLGREPLPPPHRLGLYEMANPVNHGEWVEIVGIMRGYEAASERFGTNRLVLTISSASGILEAIIDPPADLQEVEKMTGAVVRCRGVFQSIASRYGHLLGVRLLMEDFEDLDVLDPGIDSFGDRELVPVASILKFKAGSTSRLRVRGVVTMDDPGRGFYLHDGARWMWVESPQADPVWAGNFVEVIGFPTEKDGYPALLEGVFQVMYQTNIPKPVEIAVNGAFNGIYHGAFVRIRGTVVDALEQPGQHSLQLQSDDKFFQVRLVLDEDIPPVIMPERGSIVDVSGICVNDFRRRKNVVSDTEKRFEAVDVHILARRADDIVLVEPPPFWSVERVFGGFAGLVGALVLSLAWIYALRRQVGRQTSIIQDKMARETIMEERTRIARELHDTLEQELAGIQMQLDAASGHLETRPEAAGQTLDMARALLRHSRHETRRSVWDLRSTALEGGGLKLAFEEVIAMVHADSEVEINIVITGETVRLPTSMENNMLRIGQEAVSNSVEHGHATSITIELQYTAAEVKLLVRDDGKGFEPEGSHARREGHFGLLGMRERARKIGGHLEIRSEPGRGTTISLTVPVSSGTTNPEPVRES